VDLSLASRPSTANGLKLDRTPIMIALLQYIDLKIKLCFIYVSADIFEEVNGHIKEYNGLQTICEGGGRIEHDPDKKTIKVYGYSQVSFSKN